MTPLAIFIGFDHAETIAYHVLVQSLIETSSRPLWIIPLVKGHLAALKFNRPRGPLDSTDFAISRFMVPRICNYQGWALFMDADMLARADINELMEQANPDRAVLVKKHNHVPVEETKFRRQQQTRYERKNWSSLMLFNCERCRILTPEYINTAPGLDLHQFSWLLDEDIGGIEGSWNHLVGYDKYDPHANLVHFTKGTPCFANYQHQEYADEWESAFHRMQQGIEWR